MRPAHMLQDREQIPQWMPWIQSVRVLPEDTRLSRWTLATEQFGRTWELTWVSLNLAPIKNQKVTASGFGILRAKLLERAQLSTVTSKPCFVLPVIFRPPSLLWCSGWTLEDQDLMLTAKPLGPADPLAFS